MYLFDSNRYSPHIKSLHYQVPTLPLATTAAETQLLPTYHGRRLQESPIHSEDRGSFVTQHTNSSTLVTTTHSKGMFMKLYKLAPNPYLFRV